MTISPPKSFSDLPPELLLKITDHLFDHYFDCQLWPLYPYGAYTPPNIQESRMRRTTLRDYGIKHFSAIGDMIEVLRPFIHDQLGRLIVKAVDFSGSRVSYMPDARTRTAWQQLKHIEVPWTDSWIRLRGDLPEKIESIRIVDTFWMNWSDNQARSHKNSKGKSIGERLTELTSIESLVLCV